MTALIARVTSAGDAAGRLGRHVDGRICSASFMAATTAQPDRADSSSTTPGMLVPKAALERLALLRRQGPAIREPRRARSAPAPRRARRSAALTDAQWRHLARAQRESAPRRHVGLPLRSGDRAARSRASSQDVDLSLFWDAVTCPTLLLRGADSDILPRDDRRGDDAARPESDARRVRRTSDTRRCCSTRRRSTSCASSCSNHRLDSDAQ